MENGRVTRIVLENDEELEAHNVVSSAGWCETMRLCDDGQPVVNSRASGQLSFCETIATLDRRGLEHAANRPFVAVVVGVEGGGAAVEKQVQREIAQPERQARDLRLAAPGSVVTLLPRKSTPSSVTALR